MKHVIKLLSNQITIFVDTFCVCCKYKVKLIKFKHHQAVFSMIIKKVWSSLGWKREFEFKDGRSSKVLESKDGWL